MKFRSLVMKALAVSAAATLVSGVAVHETSAKLSPAATKVSIRGNLGIEQAGWKVFMIAPKGGTKIAVVQNDGSFAFNNVLKSLVRNSTLQVVDADNSYFGPIVLAKEKVGAATCAHSTLSGEQVTGVTYARKAGAFVAVANVNKSKFTKAASKATGTGVPIGAATGGVVKLTSTQKRACVNAVLGTSSNRILALDTDQNTDTGLGEDLDNDGLPNAFDADDDGDKEIDAVDTTTRNSAALNPWVELKTNNPMFNADLNPNLSSDDVLAVLGDQWSYGIQFFVGNRNLAGIDLPSTATINDVRYVYVDCGELIYCGGESPTALLMGTHASGDATPWIDYHGGWRTESPTDTASSALDTVGLGDAGTHGNALWAMNRPCPGDETPEDDSNMCDPERIYWRGALFPNQGGNTLINVKPGDVFTLNYSLNGTLKTIAMMLNPHAVTVPGLKSVNGVPYSGGAIDLNGSTTMTLEFYRPQRLIAGDEVGGGAEHNFMDMGGLQYGISLMPMGNSFNCPATTISDPVGLKTRDNVGPHDYPLQDTVATDKKSDPSNELVSFTVDVRSCVNQYSAGTWSTGSTFSFQLMGAGILLTGGSNTTSLNLTVTK